MTLREQRAGKTKESEELRIQRIKKEDEDLFNILKPSILNSLEELKERYIKGFKNYIIKIELREHSKEINEKFIDIHNYSLLRQRYSIFLQKKLEELTNNEMDFNLNFYTRERVARWKGIFFHIPVNEYFIELDFQFIDGENNEN